MSKRQRQWFNVVAKADDPSVVDIHIIDFIGGWDEDWIARNWGYDMGVTARAFVEQLANLSTDVKTIKVHINSPGGDVFAGVNIANALREQQTSKGRTVETYIVGVAASIASVVAQAGSKVVIGDNALVMVHNPWSWVIGNAKQMRKSADDLDVIRTSILASYHWHSKKSDEDLIALMDAETWMTADEAIANGLATEKAEGLKAAASLDRHAVANLTVPEPFKARVEALLAPAPAPPAAPPTAAAADTVIAACATASLDLPFAQQLIADKVTGADLQARITKEQSTRAAAASRASDIRTLCAAVKAPQLADGYIRGGTSVDDVRAHLVIFKALRDGAVEIDGTLAPDDNGRATARTISTRDIYAARNASPSTKE